MRDPRITFFRRLLCAAIVAAVPFALMALKGAIEGSLHRNSFIEAGMHATYLGLFALLPSPHRLWTHLPGAHRMVLAGIVVLLLWGQINQKHSRRNFPLITWNMYCPPAPDIDEGAPYIDVIGLSETGDAIDIAVVDLFPAIRNGFRARLGMLLAQLEQQHEGPAKQQLRDSIGRLLNTLREKHNEQHPDRPVQEVQLVQFRIPFRWTGERPEAVPVVSFP